MITLLHFHSDGARRSGNAHDRVRDGGGDGGQKDFIENKNEDISEWIEFTQR